MSAVTAPKRDVAFGWRFVDAAVAVGRKVKLRRAQGGLPYALLLPSLLLVGLLAAGLVYLAWLSFHRFDPFLAKQGSASLENYRRLGSGVGADYYRQTLIRTVITSLAVTAGAVIAAVPVAYVVVRIQRRAWRVLALLFLLVPFLMGETVRAFGWLLLIGRGGAITWAFDKIGLKVELIGKPVAVWLGMMQVMLPIATLVLMPAVRRINPDLERAALTMGARPRHVWLRVIVPLAREGVVGAAVVVFTLSMTEFAIPAVLGLGRLPMVANAVQRLYFTNNNIYVGSAFSMVLIVVVTLFVLAIVRIGRITRRT
jgi:putative spermidine/putrescine transport system permease protein